MAVTTSSTCRTASGAGDEQLCAGQTDDRQALQAWPSLFDQFAERGRGERGVDQANQWGLDMMSARQDGKPS